MKKITDFIDVKFSFNGDLGVLQHQTQSNLKTAYKLAMNEVITHEEYKKLSQDIVDYFQDMIESVNKNIYFYIR